MKRLAVLPLLLITLIWSDAHALAPRDGVDVKERGSWSIGVVSPLRVGVADGVELTLHPLLALVAPHLTVRASHGEVGDLRVVGEYRISVPTLAMRALGGTVFPEWGMSDLRIGWLVVPSTELVVSHGERDVTSVRAGLSFGIPLGPNDVRPLDSYAPVDLLLAPALQRYRARIGIGHDRGVAEWLRLRTFADAWLVGEDPQPRRSPLFLSAGVGLDASVTKRARLALGIAWYNSDQRRTRVVIGEDGHAERQRRRSNDFFPMLDFIWGTSA